MSFIIASNFSATTVSLGYVSSNGAGPLRIVGNGVSTGGGVMVSPNPISICMVRMTAHVESITYKVERWFETVVFGEPPPKKLTSARRFR